MAKEILKVLLIEHDEGFARYAVEMLGQARELEIESRAVPDLQSGLQALREMEPHVVLLDLVVPDGAGLGSLFLLRAVAPHVPVVICGEPDEEVIALEAMNAGAEDYLVRQHLTPGWLERSLRYAIERNNLDMALLAAEQKYHSLFDHLVEGIFRTTPGGCFLLANNALARIYGYSSPEELMREVRDVRKGLYVQPGRREEFVQLMNEHDTISDFESQVFRKDGRTIWISENCRAIRDSQGTLLYFEGTVEDITERRQAEERLRNSEALYHSLVETLPQNIFRKDIEGRFTFGNQQFCRTLGKSLDEIVGKTDFDFFPPSLAAKYQADDRRVMATGRPFDIVEEHQPPGGQKMYVQVVKTPLYGAEGNLIGLQGIFWDITQQRLADEKLRRVNTLLAQSRKELRIKNMQMEEDLRMAREIQLTMLPQQYPPFQGDGAGSAFTFTHRYLPTGSVGGDFFSISALSDSDAAVFICDVAGHGVRSALVTAMVRALVEELKPLAMEPGKFLTKLNADLHAILRHTGTPMLTTAFYLVASCREGVMRYANAGHPKPLHIRRGAGKVEMLANASGKPQPALGLFEDGTYETTTTALQERDAVMLFTDGLYEVQNRDDALYTQELLIEGVQRRIQLQVGPLFDEILDEVRKFSAGVGFTDDVCLVGMEHDGGG